MRREGKEIVFLNELRFRKDSPLDLRISLDRLEVPAVKAALGYEGIVRGVDYRGIPVVAATRASPIPPGFSRPKSMSLRWTPLSGSASNWWHF